MGSLSEERSKATGASLRITQKRAARPPPPVIRLPPLFTDGLTACLAGLTAST
jgi:hypothetical protein